MDYQRWVNLFGKPVDDVAVHEALTKSGIKGPIKIGKDDLSTRVDIADEGTTVVFTSETILRPDDPTAAVGRPIVSAVMVILDQSNKKNLYTGPLPYNLIKDNSQEALRARLGAPAQSNDKYRTDAWELDGMIVAASYSKDLQAITQVSLSLPNSH